MTSENRKLKNFCLATNGIRYTFTLMPHLFYFSGFYLPKNLTIFFEIRSLADIGGLASPLEPLAPENPEFASGGGCNCTENCFF